VGKFSWGKQACLLVGLGRVLFAVSHARSASPTAPTRSYAVVHSYPHDPEAFTQGLLYEDGFLYESTGLEGHSSLRKVELDTGRVVHRVDVPGQYFAEGLAEWRNQLVQLTWVSHVGFVYDRVTFRRQSEFHYAGEGWGLTQDGRNLIMSDGSDTLRYLELGQFRIVRKLPVKDGSEPVANLNELEYVQGQILANVWQTDLIACISPETGRVSWWLDLAGLLPAADRRPDTDVLNGIAYDDKNDRLFVTGKRWPKLFEIKIAGFSRSTVTHVRQ
jgi:glutamine cyclotransferase